MAATNPTEPPPLPAAAESTPPPIPIPPESAPVLPPPISVAVKPRTHRWRNILLASIAAMVLLILAAPTLVSWCGKSFILGKINSRIAGRIEADSFSIGWFSGVKVSRLKLFDPDGQLIADAPAISTGYTVFDALSSNIDLGKASADISSLNIVVADDGSTNLARALAPRTRTPHPAAASAAAPTLFKTDMHLAARSVTISEPGSPVVSVDNTSLDLQIDTAGRSPLVLTLASTVTVGNAAATPISAKFNIQLFSAGAIRSFGQIMGTANGDLGTQDAALVSPLLAKAGVKIQPGGTVKVSFNFNAPAAGEGVLEAPLIIDATAVTEAGDLVPLKSASATLRATLRGDTFTLVAGTGIQSEFLTLTAAGTVSQTNMDIIGTVDYTLERIARLGQRFLPATTSVIGENSTSFHLYGSPTLAGIVLDSKSNTAIMFDQFAIPAQGIDAHSGKIGLSMQAGKLYVAASDIATNKGKFTIIGYVDLLADKPAFIIPEPVQLVVNAQINKTLGDHMLVWLPATWGLGDMAAARVSGNISLRINQAYIPLDYQEFLKTGTMQGTVSITNFTTDSPLFSSITNLMVAVIKLSPFDLGFHPGTISDVSFSIRNGKVHYDNLRLTMPGMSVTFSGDVGLDTSGGNGAPLDMVVSLRQNNIPAAFTFQLTGTTKNYHLKLDPIPIQKAIETVPNFVDQVFKGLNLK